MRYNRLKLDVLTAFEGRGWLSVRMVSQLAGLSPVRLCYTYLLRLHRFGLLHRRRGSLIVYRLSERGRRRLLWLRRR
jgi:hypothetical protein